MRGENDTGNEDMSLWSGPDLDVPFVTDSDLSPNRREQHGHFRTQAVDSIPSSAQGRWKVCSAGVTDLPEGEARKSSLHASCEQLRAHSTLDLDGVAASNIDSALPCIELVACERRQELSSVFAVERAAERGLMSDLARTGPGT